MEASTLSSAGKAVPYMRMTDRAIPCQEPIMAADFKECRIPGGVDLWTRRGFYSPGVCFVGYMPHCTQTIELSDAWPLRDGETTVRCIPENYDCNAQDKDQRYATTVFANTVLSAPAFEVRWRSEDLKHGTAKSPGPGASISLPTRTVILDGPASRMNSVHTAATTVTTTPTPIVVTTTAAASESTAPAPGATPLGPGYVAAIAVGTAFGALALVLAVLLWTLRRRSRAREEALSSGDSVVHGTVEGLEPAVSQQQSQGPPAEMEHSPTGARELPAGSSGLAPSQLSSRHPMGPFEMATEPKVDSK